MHDEGARRRRRGGGWARRTRRTALICAVGVVASTAWPVVPSGARPAATAGARGDSIVLEWNAAVLEGVRRSGLGPPMVARALAIVHTCIYDAWAAYDQKAVGTRLGGTLRRPPRERGNANRARAISFAAYRAATDLMPAGAALFDDVMAGHGYDPADATTDVSTAAGVGNVACRAVLEFRHHDGANQLGDLNGGAPYSDYTGYAPANDPMDLRVPFEPATVKDPDRWQPLRYADASGAVVTPGFVAPYWDRVAPFALTSADQFRSGPGPARFGSDGYVEQARRLLDISAGLTDREKVIAEYWADGPRSETPPGHWNLFAQYVSRRDHHGVNEDVKMFFALNNAVFDAGIAAWADKIDFDSVRPITAVRHLFAGRQVTAWGGPYQGTTTIDGADWLPYQPSSFPTPPFAEYCSGHSNFSAAGAEILERFTGSDAFGASVTVPAGSSTVEPGAVPAGDQTLAWATFSEAADEAGISRLYGGIHFTDGDLDSRAMGRLVAAQTWDRAQALFRGTA